LVNSEIRTQINKVKVPAIVFDYPRHSRATDEGMAHGSSILAYLVFGPGRTSTRRIARTISIIIWRGPEARLGIQGKARRDLVELKLV
jgi:hypothetical protein